jgi:hypothetical protein
MVHDADLEDEKFDRKEAVGIDLMLKGLAHMQTSSDEIWLPESRRSKRYFMASRAGVPRSVLMPLINIRVIRIYSRG